MNGQHTLIFDCDGVLVDRENLSHQVLQQMLAEYGTTLTLQATLDHFMGTSTEKCLSVLSALTGRPAPDDFLDTFQAKTFALFKTSLTPVQRVPELLASLRMPFCVASNGPLEKMHFTLGHTGLLPHFQGRLFSADHVERPKPAPDLFLHAAAALKARPEHCVVVEDSPTGVRAAKAAGMHAVGYAAMGQGRRLLEAGADQLLDSMQALPDLLLRWRAGA